MTKPATKYREFLDAIGGMSVVDFAVEWPFDGMPAMRVIHDQATAEERVPWVLGIPLASPDDIRVVWLELHGPVDLTPWLTPNPWLLVSQRLKRQDPSFRFDLSTAGEIAAWEQSSKVDWVILSGSPIPPLTSLGCGW